MSYRCAMILLLCGLLPLSFSVSRGSASIYYHVSDLGPIGQDASAGGQAVAVVAGSAEVVGQSTSKAGVGTPAVWSGAPPAPTSLLTSIPDATAGSAWSLDGGGDIVGQVTMGGLARAFYLPADGNPTILPTLASGSASSAVAKGVNAAGQVVGYSNCSATGVINHAFVWTSAGGMVNLGDFTGNAATPLASGAAAVNSGGQIVGYSYETNGSCDAATWTKSGSTWTIADLNPTHSVCKGSSGAYAVNQSGDAVGSGDATGLDNGTMEAVLFQPGGTVVVLPGLGSASPFDAAYGINQGGLIVGTAETSSYAPHAFLYNNATGTQDLNGRLVTDGSSAGWDLQYAYGITDSGYITGTGTSAAGATHAYLLTPVMQGDANEDGRVDVNDLTIVLTDFDRSVGANGWTLGDFNGAGKVDINDLTIVLASFGQSLGTSAAGTATVPEPAAAVLAAGALIGLLGCGRRKVRPAACRFVGQVDDLP